MENKVMRYSRLITSFYRYARARENKIILNIILILLLNISIVPIACANNYLIKKNEEITIEDQIFIPTGDIIIETGGKLTIHNAKVIFTHEGCFEHGIFLKENATLQIYNSQIRGTNNLFFFKIQNSTLIIKDSKIRMTHIICGNSSRILIVNSELWALNCFNESTASILDTRLNYLFLRGRSSAHVNNSHIAEVLLYDCSKASISDTDLKYIFCFDKGFTTLHNCTYNDILRFKQKVCNLTITILDENNHDAISSVKVTIERPRGCKVASSITNEDGMISFFNIEEGSYFAEIEIEGYTSMNKSIQILNEEYHETLLIHRKEEKAQIPTNFLPIIALVIVILFFIIYRFHSYLF